MDLNSTSKNTIRSAVLVISMLFGIAGIAVAAGTSTSGESDHNRVGKEKTAPKKNDVRHGNSKKSSGADPAMTSSQDSPSGGVGYEEQTGVIGKQPSGRDSETDGQRRGGAGY